MLDLTRDLEMAVAVALATLTALAVFLKATAKSASESSASESSASESSLRGNFLLAYLPALMGDWLQGPYVYALYARLGFSSSTIAALFLVGFVSGSTLGSLAGSMADKFGRRRMTKAFCLIYALSCVTKLSHNLPLLLLGRLLGGVATSLLFTVYEAWYVSEHRALGLSSDSMSATFGVTTFCNGLVAILAGVLANVAVGTPLGVTAPFLMALPCFLFSFVVVSLRWTENHGDAKSVLSEGWRTSVALIFQEKRVLLLGLVQSIVESCMYVFVFLWTPMLQSEEEKDGDEKNKLPLGLIFSSFMLAIMLGSLVFNSAIRTLSIERMLAVSVALFTIANYICAIAPHYRLLCYGSFLLLEFSLGMYFPSSGSLRGKLVVEEHRATISNLFRVPLNLFTVSGLMLTRNLDHGLVFALMAALLTVATGLTSVMFNQTKTVDGEKKRI